MVNYNPKLAFITAATLLCLSQTQPAFAAQPASQTKPDSVDQCLDFAEDLLSIKMETTKEMQTQSQMDTFAAPYIKNCLAGGKKTAKQISTLKKQIHRAKETAPNFSVLEESYAEANTLLCATLAGVVLRYEYESGAISTPEQGKDFLNLANQLCSYKSDPVENAKGELHFKTRLGIHLGNEDDPDRVERVEQLLRLQAYEIAQPLCMTTAKEVYKGSPIALRTAKQACENFPVRTWNDMVEKIPLAEWIQKKNPSKPEMGTAQTLLGKDPS